MNKIRLILVDDRPFFRVSCCRLLEKGEDIDIVGDCGTPEEAINLVKASFPEIVVMENLIGDTPAVELIKRLKQISPTTRYIILATVLRQPEIPVLLGAGVRVFIDKEDATGYLVPAIPCAMEDKLYLSPKCQKYYSRPFGFPTVLCGRE